MLTIIHCVNNLDLGGLERMVITLSQQLKNRGHLTSICCIENRGALADEAESAGIPVHALNMEKVGKLSALRSFCTFLRNCHQVSGSSSQPSGLRSRPLRSQVSSFSPVIVHSHNFKPFYYSALATILGAADGHIHTRHGAFIRHHRATWRYRLLRCGVNTIVTVSVDGREELARLSGLRVEEIGVVPNGVDTEWYRPRPTDHSPQTTEEDRTESGNLKPEAGRRLDATDQGQQPTDDRHSSGLDPHVSGLRSQVSSLRSPVILTVARLSPEKDLVTLLRAFKFVLEQWESGKRQEASATVGPAGPAGRSETNTDNGAPGRRALPHSDKSSVSSLRSQVSDQPPRLAVVGDGPCMAELQTEANRLGIRGQVDFLGARNDIPVLLQSAKVFALSSLSEGLSIALIEAASCGLPIVATNVGGNPEIVNVPHGGRLVPPRDPSAMAEALLELLRNKSLAHSMSLAARQRAIEHFSIDTMVDRYVELYEKAIGSQFSVVSNQ